MFDGVDGLDEILEAGLVDVDLVADLLADVLDNLAPDDEVELVGGLFLAALAGVLAGVLDEDLAGVFAGVFAGVLTGVLESCCESAPVVKLNSLMGDTEDLLLASDFAVDAVPLLDAEARFLLVEAEIVLFLIGVGVFLAVELAFGRGVALMGLELRLTGVGVCLAILLQ